MPLTPPIDHLTNLPHAERMLVMAGAKVGKTTTALDWALWMEITGSDGRVLYLDADRTLQSSLQNPKYEKLRQNRDRIVPFVGHHWKEIRENGKRAVAMSRPGDLIVVDMVTRPWAAAKEYYQEYVFGDEDDHLLQIRKEWDGDGKQPGEVEGWDWQYINSIYNRFILPIMYQSPAHVLLLAVEEEVGEKDFKSINNRSPLADPEMYKVAHQVRARPVGQKSLVYQAETILRLERERMALDSPRRASTALQERVASRRMLEKEKWQDVVVSYLVPVAGWTT